MVDILAAALNAVDAYCGENKAPGTDVMRARVRAMLRAYHKFWEKDNEDYEVLGVEELLLGPIKSLKGGCKDSGYLAGGKIDVRARYKKKNQLIILDHKNLSGEMDDNDKEHLLIEPQLNQYAYLEYLNGNRVDAAVWDVLAKTAHRPNKAGKTRKTDETLEEFEERLYAVYTENPSKYFARIHVPILRYNMADHAQELYSWTRLLDSAKQSGEHLRNADSCFQYMRPCKYLGICSGRSDIEDKSVWTTKKSPHAELDLPEGVDPMKVITNSRLKTFKACYRKHEYAYNRAIVKVNESVEEVLYVGTASHCGLEIYWKSLRTNQGL